MKVVDTEDSTQVIRSVGVIERQATKRPGGLIALTLLLLAAGLALGTWSLVTLLSTVVGQVVVPDITTRSPDQATRLLLSAGLEPFPQGSETSDTIAEGLVTRQEPPAKRSVAKGSQVRFWTSSGIQRVEVPPIRGLKVNEAARRLEAVGLELGTRTPEFSTEEAGTVLSQNPRAGQVIDKGENVEVTVSQGEERGIVPDVVGQEEADAVGILANGGFRVNRIRETHPSVVRGRVFAQDPRARAEAPPGSVVNIFVSIGPESFAMPDVRGETEADARSELEGMGLVVRSVRVFTPTESERGRVINQTPPVGTTVRRGDTVEIEVGSAT